MKNDENSSIDKSYCTQGWKKPRFFGFFLGFNVHNAEHRYMTYDK